MAATLDPTVFLDFIDYISSLKKMVYGFKVFINTLERESPSVGLLDIFSIQFGYNVSKYLLIKWMGSSNAL
jgi:hypothetical protein